MMSELARRWDIHRVASFWKITLLFEFDIRTEPVCKQHSRRMFAMEFSFKSKSWTDHYVESIFNSLTSEDRCNAQMLL